ncbi:MAG: methylmalonyl-CoA mutase family protein [Thermoplasmata archaeon]
MVDSRSRKELEAAREAWEKEDLAASLRSRPERKERFLTTSSEEVGRLYTPLDVPDFDYPKDLGFPGEYPFTRGIHPTMYRGRPWTIRQFAGHGDCEDTNIRYRYLLEHGETGLSVAVDMPTLYGLDTDDREAEGEFGICGVAISSLRDMEVLFEGIPVDQVSTSLTINGPAAVLWAMYIAMAEGRGVSPARLRGTIQNDILKEYQAQKEWLFPPEPHMRLVVDTIEYAAKELPLWNPISISGYRIREAGSTAIQELAFTLSNGFEYVRWGLDRGLDVDAFAPRLSFFFNAHNDLFEEIAKYRAARRIWAREMRDTFGAKNPRSWWMRFHTQTAGVSLTAQQPEINIVRVAIQALAAILGGTQSLHTNSMDEAWAVPTERAVRIALRTQQVLAHESGVVNTADPLGGSYYLEWMTDHMEEEAYRYFDRIEKLGGVIPAIKRGFYQREIARSAYRYQREIETGERTIVGVNAYTTDEPEAVEYLRIDKEAERRHMRRLERLRQDRDSKKVERSLASLRRGAEGDANLMPLLLEGVKAGVTLGETVSTLKEVFGVYEEPLIY